MSETNELEECPGCGAEIDNGTTSANGYCAPCWNQRYGCADEEEEEEEHRCSGEWNYGGREQPDQFLCDNNDDPRCPWYKTPLPAAPCSCGGCKATIASNEMTGISHSLPPEEMGFCKFCAKNFTLINAKVCRAACWPCQQERRLCADCGGPPPFHCYRGDDALCATCEEVWYGPPSP